MSNNQAMRSILFFTILLPLSVYAVVDDGSVLHTGVATYYSDTTFGHCGFPTSQQQYYHGAMNHEDYDSAAACGTWVHITGPSGEVTAFIDDECPECKKGDIDLGPRTFAVIGDLKAGRIPISWRYVEAPITGPIQYFWKDGSSQWHIELQIRNHRYAINKVEICIPPGDFLPMPRQTYNFFKLAGGVGALPGPYTIRVTDIFGRQLVDSNVALVAEQVFDGKANFPEGQAAVAPCARQREAPFSDQPIFCIFSVSGGFSLRRLPPQATLDLYGLTGQFLGRITASDATMQRLKALGMLRSVIIARISRM